MATKNLRGSSSKTNSPAAPDAPTWAIRKAAIPASHARHCANTTAGSAAQPHDDSKPPKDQEQDAAQKRKGGGGIADNVIDLAAPHGEPQWREINGYWEMRVDGKSVAGLSRPTRKNIPGFLTSSHAITPITVGTLLIFQRWRAPSTLSNNGSSMPGTVKPTIPLRWPNANSATKKSKARIAALHNDSPPPANQNSADPQAANQNTKPDAFRLADFVGEDGARAINEPLPPHVAAEYLRDYLRDSVQHVIDRFDEFYRSDNCPLPSQYIDEQLAKAEARLSEIDDRLQALTHPTDQP